MLQSAQCKNSTACSGGPHSYLHKPSHAASNRRLTGLVHAGARCTCGLDRSRAEALHCAGAQAAEDAGGRHETSRSSGCARSAPLLLAMLPLNPADVEACPAEDPLPSDFEMCQAMVSSKCTDRTCVRTPIICPVIRPCAVLCRAMRRPLSPLLTRVGHLHMQSLACYELHQTFDTL